MADLENLTIEINAKATKANEGIDKLVGKLDRLSGALGKLDGSKLVNSLNSISDISKANGFDNLAKQAENFSKGMEVATTKMNKTFGGLSEKYKDLGKGFELKGSTDYLQKQIDSLSNSLAKAKVKKDELESSGKTDGKMYEYAVRDVIKYENQIESLKNQILSLKEISSNIDLVITRDDSDVSSVNESNSNTATVSASSMNYDPRAMAAVFGEAAGQIQNYSQAVEQFGINAGLVLNEGIDTSGIESAASSASASVERLKTSFSGLSSVGAKAKSVFSGIISVLAKFGSGVKNSISKIAKLGKSFRETTRSSRGLSNGFSSGIKTLLKYGFGVRTLFALVNKLKSAIKDGMQNLVQYSSATNSSVSLLSNSMNQLKNASASMVAPLLNALAPALNSIIQLCIRAANAVNQLIAALTGKSSWVKAKTLTDDYAASLGGVGGAAKDAGDAVQKGIRTFDELNVISTNESTSSGGSGGGGTGASDMFETVPIDSAISDFAKSIKDAWENADFEGIGEIISEKLTNALNSIPWESIYEKARGFGTGLADFLNGLISPELFGTVGSTIASALNTAIYTALSFGENFDFYNFGVSIATGINNFFDTFDFEALAETLNIWVDNLKLAIAGFLDTLTWKNILSATTTFLGTLKIDTVEAIIGTLLIKKILGYKLASGALSGLSGWLKGKILSSLGGGITISSLALRIKNFTINWASISPESFVTAATPLLEGLGDAINQLLPEWCVRLLSSIGGGLVLGALGGSWFPGAGTVAGAIIGAIIGAMDGIEIDGKSILNHIIDGIFNFDYTLSLFEQASDFFEKAKEAFEDKDWLGVGADIVQGLLSGITGAFSFISEPILDLFNLIYDGICSLFGIHSPSTVMKEVGGYIIDGLLKGIKDTWKSVTKWFSDLPGNIKKVLGNAKDWLKEKGQNAIEGIKNGWESVKNSKLLQKVGKLKDEAFSAVGDIASKVKQKGSDLISGIKTGYENSKQSGLLSKVSTLKDNIYSSIGDVASKVKQKGTDLITGIKNGYENSKQSGLLSKVSTLKDSIYTSIGSVSDKVKSRGKEIVTGIKSGFENNRSTIKSAVSGIPNLISNGIGSLWNVGRSAISSFINGFSSMHIPMPHINWNWNSISLGSLNFKIPTFNVKWYATGGFPEDGWFRANQGEIMGRFDNGKSVVANNMQITEGISQAVYQGNREMVKLMSQEIAETRKQNEILTQILAKEFGVTKDDIGKAAQSWARDYSRRTGREAYSF